MRSAWTLGRSKKAFQHPFYNAATDGPPNLLDPILAAKYPGERLGLLSYTQDNVIRTYLGLSATDFQTDLYAFAATRLDPLPQFHYYFVTGSSHTFLGNPAATTAQGTPLWTWLSRFVTDDPAWASTKP